MQRGVDAVRRAERQGANLRVVEVKNDIAGLLAVDKGGEKPYNSDIRVCLCKSYGWVIIRQAAAA